MRTRWCQDGGFATVGINYTQLGQKTAEMAAAVLEGTPISELPVETLSEFGTYINQTTAEQIGVEIPAGDRRDGDHPVVKCG